MAEASFYLVGHSGNNRIRVEPTSISAQGGPEYPRLIVPAGLDLNPIVDHERRGRQFTIFDLQCGLFVHERFKISDAISNFRPYRLYSANVSTSCSLEFPLDAYRIQKIEEKRKGDLKIRLDLLFIVALYEPLVPESGKKQNISQYLTGIESSLVQLNIEIPQSHWVDKVLPPLGFGEYFIIEVPRGKNIIQEAWKYIEKAEAAFNSWNTEGVYSNCRELGTLLDRTMKAKFRANHFAYIEKWSRAYEKFDHFASLGLHLEDIKKSPKYAPGDVKIGKADAEHLIIVTKALIKYAAELLQEAPSPTRST